LDCASLLADEKKTTSDGRLREGGFSGKGKRKEEVSGLKGGSHG